MRALGIAVHCSAHLQLGVLTGIVAINADLEIGATKRDPRILQVAELTVPSHNTLNTDAAAPSQRTS